MTTSTPPSKPERAFVWQGTPHNRRKAHRKAKRQIAHQARRRGR